jgi:hypothetical protein
MSIRKAIRFFVFLSIIVSSAPAQVDAPNRVFERHFKDGRQIVVDLDSITLTRDAKPVETKRYNFKLLNNKGAVERVLYTRSLSSTNSAVYKSPEIEVLFAGLIGEDAVVAFNQWGRFWAYRVSTATGEMVLDPPPNSDGIGAAMVEADIREDKGDIELVCVDASKLVYTYKIMAVRQWRLQAVTTQPAK